MKAMKKIVFATVPMKKDIEKRKYSVDGNALIESKEPICYAVNPAVASKLTKEDEVSVILLKTNGGEGGHVQGRTLFHFGRDEGQGADSRRSTEYRRLRGGQSLCGGRRSRAGKSGRRRRF